MSEMTQQMAGDKVLALTRKADGKQDKIVVIHGGQRLLLKVNRVGESKVEVVLYAPPEFEVYRGELYDGPKVKAAGA